MGKYSRRRKRDLPEAGNWLLTYSDMVTLLLTFFVLLFAFSTTDISKFQAVLFSLRMPWACWKGARPWTSFRKKPSYRGA